MKKFKKIVAMGCAAMMSLSLLGNSVSAIDIEMTDDAIVVPRQTILQAYQELVENIEYRYEDNYEFENFNYQISDTKKDENGDILVNIDIVADMILTQHASDNLYLQNLKTKTAEITNSETRTKIDNIITSYIDEINSQYYMKADKTAFLYTIRIPKNSSGEYELYYRADFEEEMYVPFVYMYKDSTTLNDIQTKVDNTISALTNSINNTNAINMSFAYDRIAAREYALAHATDEPEFSSANRQGSDCANFVSKCLNNGGIPIDRSGSWHPSLDGTVNTCGINWMRTGYNNNGGVVPYMTGKGYFYHQPEESMVFAGGIVYQTNRSHVMFTVYGDTQVIKYAQHSDYRLSYNSAIIEYNVGNCPRSVKYYMPNASIME